MSDELKPCPLCQSNRVTAWSPGSYWELPKKRGVIHCSDCGCSAPEKAWNTRQPDLAAEVERLRGENAQIKSLVAELDQRIEALGGCSDGSCIIKRPKGMHTNGGCRCPRDGGKMICFTAYVEYFRRMARAALGEQP